MLLSRMFYFIQSGKVHEPIYSSDQAPSGTSNKDFLQEYVATLLRSAFSNLQEYVDCSHIRPAPICVCFANFATSQQIQQFVLGLFSLNDDFPKFKTHLRDFLISLKEFGTDNTELYAEEREQAAKDAKAAERDRAMKVGGLLKPSDMDDEL